MKRRALQIVVFLLLGAIVNVAVAWACAYFNRGLLGESEYEACTMPYGTWEAEVYKHFGEEIVISERQNDPKTTIVSDTERTPVDLISRWPGFDRPLAEFANANRVVIEFRMAIARGLPCLALWSERTDLSVPVDGFRIEPKIKGGIPLELSWPTNGTGSWTFDLPYRPIWPGFAINTIFYAAVLWVMFELPFALRRRLRIRRGLCPACAYPVGTSPVCTECGGAVKRSEVSSQKSEDVQT